MNEELIGRLIDIVEDFLEIKEIASDDEAYIVGGDYDWLAAQFRGLLFPEEPKKYVMIVTEEDERYMNGEVELGYFWDHPWEGKFVDTVYGDSFEDLMANGDYEGLFQQTFVVKTGERISYGAIDSLTPREEIEEYEEKKND